MSKEVTVCSSGFCFGFDAIEEQGQDYFVQQQLSKDIILPFLRREMASLLHLVDS